MNDKEFIAFYAMPMIREARGETPETKALVLARFREGQRALFLFQVLHGHADGGILGFYRQISYLTETLDVWAALKSAFRYFEDPEMLVLIERMAAAYSAGLPSEDFKAEIDELDRLYAAQIPKTVRQIASRVRNNPEDFQS
jgi:hypothetical protein